jgi:hypothetical protein
MIYSLLGAFMLTGLEVDYWNKWTDVALLILVSWKFLAASCMNMLCAIVLLGLIRAMWSFLVPWFVHSLDFFFEWIVHSLDGI